MWKNVSVNLSDVVEVRGSALTEKEIWILLHEIGKQLKNFIIEEDVNITPNNILIHPSAGVFMDFSNKSFSEINLNYPFKNVLTYSLGMTMLWCLQYGMPRGKYLNVSVELQSSLNAITSENADLQLLQHVIKSHTSSDSIERSATDCLVKMYNSVLGSTGYTEMHPCMPVQNTLQQGLFHRYPETLIGPVHEHTNKSVKRQLSGDSRRNSSTHKESLNNSRKLNTSITSSTSIPRQRDAKNSSHHILHRTVPVKTVSQRKPESVFRSDDPPLQMNLCMEKGNFQLTVKAVVECFNGKSVIFTINPNKISCGYLLSMSVSHLISSCDTSLFGLSVFQDGEYCFLDPTLTIQKVISLSDFVGEPHLFLRLKFLPPDFQSMRDEKLLQSIYVQIREDLMNGRIVCNYEQAIMLAAYSLQYELGDFEVFPIFVYQVAMRMRSLSTVLFNNDKINMNTTEYFHVRDFVPSALVDDIGLSHLSFTLPQLHARLKGTLPSSARELFFRKAKELQDFGCHFSRVYMSHRDQPPVWISIGPRGLNIFYLLSCGVRKLIHRYSWEQLSKVAFKKKTISLTTKSGTRFKFYVKTEQKANYIVRIMGEMHQFHMFDDSWNNDKFNSIASPSTQLSSGILPFKHHPIPHPCEMRCKSEELHISEQMVDGNHTISSSHSHLQVFPDIIPFVLEDNNSDISRDYTTKSKCQQVVNDDKQPIYHEPEIEEVASEEFISDKEFENIKKEEDDDVFDVSDLPVPIINDISADFFVDLEKRKGTFGFSVMGGSDKSINVIKVQHIVPGGSAEMNGSLQAGDVILAINDIQLSNVSHKEAVEILSKASNKSRLHVRRDQMLRLESNPVVPDEQLQEVQNGNCAVNEITETGNAGFNTQSERIVGRNVDDDINELTSLRLDTTYDERVTEVASAFYNYQYTDIESDIQHEYIGNGAEDLTMKDELHLNLLHHGEDMSRGEGDGVSNLSTHDRQNTTGSLSQSGRFSDISSHVSRDVIPEATTVAIADFEEFRRRLSSLKTANESSNNSGDNESWSTVHE
ncbi:FERM and PDZ domain-containing protein 2-like isoform X2 [Styela clava]